MAPAYSIGERVVVRNSDTYNNDTGIVNGVRDISDEDDCPNPEERYLYYIVLDSGVHWNGARQSLLWPWMGASIPFVCKCDIGVTGCTCGVFLWEREYTRRMTQTNNERT